MSSRRTGPPARVLAACGLFAPVAMTAGWVVAGALQPGHDPLREDVSVLAGMEARHAWMAIAAICLTGLLVVATGLRVGLDGRRWPPALAPLLMGGGLAVAAAGGLRIDCSEDASAACLARSEQGLLSWHDQAHNLASVAAALALVAAAVVVALHRPAPPGLRRASVAAAVLTLALFAVYRGGLLEWGGAVERALITVPLVWIALLAGHGGAAPATAPHALALAPAARVVPPCPPRREAP